MDSGYRVSLDALRMVVARKDPEPIIAQDPRYKGVQERLVGLMSSWCWSSQADA